MEKETIYKRILETIDNHSILKKKAADANFLFDHGTYEHYGIIAMDILAVRDNHPKHGTKKKWNEFFDRGDGGWHKQNGTHTAYAALVWSPKKNKVHAILLSTQERNVYPATNYHLDLKWAREQLKFLWDKTLIEADFPLVEVYYPERRIPIFEHYLACLNEDKYSRIFPYLHNQFVTLRNEGLKKLAAFNTALTREVLKRFIKYEDRTEVLDTLARTIKKMKIQQEMISFIDELVEYSGYDDCLDYGDSRLLYIKDQIQLSVR